MSVKSDLQRAVLGMRGLPNFNDFIKTLTGRREHVVTQMINGPITEVEVLRGEARAYDYILNAVREP
jgi:hypothetical protein